MEEKKKKRIFFYNTIFMYITLRECSILLRAKITYYRVNIKRSPGIFFFSSFF